MVDYSVRGPVALLEVNNPPVNALSTHVRQGIMDCLQKANVDQAVNAIVIAGKHRKFLAGADIREFGQPLREPMLTDVTHSLERNPKPVVAAIEGFALGGGFEIAISCHYRVGTNKSFYGFPEVNIGILPGATGTQRFPRLASLKLALDIIPTGRRLQAAEALKAGAIDQIASNNVIEAAISLAQRVGHMGTKGRKTSEMPIKDADQADALVQAALATAASKAKGMLAPVMCIKAVHASALFPFQQGLDKEREYMGVLAMSGQARALQYAFFAERAAQKWSAPGGANFKNTKPLPYKTGAVIGAGTMGTGISMAMLNAGIPVTLIEQDQKFLDKGVKTLKQLYEGSVRLGRMSEEQARKCMSMLKPSIDYADLRDIDIVIEAVYENLGLKKKVFAKLDKACKPSALLCSNTSALDIDQMAESTSRPDKVVGTHFFVPAYYMRLLENIRGNKTSPESMATVMEFGNRLGKVSILVGNCFGFVANRMMGKRAAEAGFLLEDGAFPEQVDQVIEDFGIPIGPFKVSDLSGIDIGWRTRMEILEKLGIKFDPKCRTWYGQRYSSLADSLCEQGRFGRKTGAGWYRYEKPGAKVPIPDPWIHDFILEHCRNVGIERRHITPNEIYERCIYPTINEGFKILEEGIASKPEDIDIAIMLGYSWPKQTGGPMFMASQIGLQHICDRIKYYNELYPDVTHWEPSKLLVTLSANEVPFNQWMKHVGSSSSKL